MLLGTDKVEFLVGNMETVAAMPLVPSLRPFDRNAVLFLEEVSKRLLGDASARQYPDVMAYAFWIRRASLEKMSIQYRGNAYRLGRGLVFHVTPANIPVQFAYSLTASLLSGNANIVRLSQREFPQVSLLCEAYRSVLETWPAMAGYLCLVRYEHDIAITQKLSDACDLRIIWGGDRAIDDIRNAKLPARSSELTFADRFSLCIINSEEYLIADNKAKLARAFYADTYYSDQNACSSPRLVVWTGSRAREAGQCFWASIRELTAEKYDLPNIQVVDKLVAFCKLAAKQGGIHGEGMLNGGNYVNVLRVDALVPELMNHKCSGGYFFEYAAKQLSNLMPMLTKECQTIAYFGVDPEEIARMVFDAGAKGVDRIVPLGKTMDLSLQWEGVDLIEAMSRSICVVS